MTDAIHKRKIPILILFNWCIMRCSSEIGNKPSRNSNSCVSLRSFSHSSSMVKAWVKVANQCKVEHLNLFLPSTIRLSFSVFTSTTLVVLKLSGLYMQNDHSFVSLPSLKILYLRLVCFLELEYIIEFLSACPNLEVLVMKSLKSVGHRNTVSLMFLSLLLLFRCNYLITWSFYVQIWYRYEYNSSSI